MPKDRRVNSSSFDRSMVSPYPCSSKFSDCKSSKSSLPRAWDEKEWEEVRCPICMEHPHNAILLLCSSHKKGCRPFICDTSYRHSNCFDQFRKSSSSADFFSLTLEEQSGLVCPLCRGTVTGWNVVHPAREFLNCKTRSCALETCSFNGNYSELRKHARLEHPSKRPSEASPDRQSNWMKLQQQRDIEDALVYQSDIEYDFELGLDSLIVDDFWSSGRDGLLSLDEWGGDDFWSGGTLFDLPSVMSDVEEDLSTLSGLSMPFFMPYSSPLVDEMMDSGNSRSGDDDMNDIGNTRNGDRPQWATISGSRSNLHLENAEPSLVSSGPSFHSEDDANASRSRQGYHQREGDSSNSFGRSGHQRENSRTISTNRPSHHREEDRRSIRERSSYTRANDSNASRSRSRYFREIGPGSSRRRSSYRSSRSRSGFSRSRDFVPPVRRYGTSSFRGSSRQPRSDYSRRRD